MDWERKNVFQYCIGDGYLKGEISKLNLLKKCFFCGEKRLCITIKKVSDYVDFAISNFYSRTSLELDSFQWVMMNDRESDYSFHRYEDPIKGRTQTAWPL